MKLVYLWTSALVVTLLAVLVAGSLAFSLDGDLDSRGSVSRADSVTGFAAGILEETCTGRIGHGAHLAPCRSGGVECSLRAWVPRLR